ncbi:hypothetical protein KX729_23980 [Rhizobium sp. XQZ8]|uniref:hypothetical protein n=1 Tax=Rhizobium populisoli TaxID=2859785 RepID=UPI001CA584CF|nr:hypothetical protein [Rhizobium populisoli]MBW6424513.1 hypothetical protein [Rhizobium populisoli]
MPKYVIRTCLLAAALAVGIIGYNLFDANTEAGCGITNGHWGSAVSICYPRSCFDKGDCGGPWVSTAIPCNDVQPGETEAMLHFYFGNPDRKEGDHIYWSTGKPDRWVIEARMNQGRLSELKCPNYEPAPI